MEDRWLSVDEIAAYLGIKPDTVYKWIGRKDMPAHTLGTGGLESFVRVLSILTFIPFGILDIMLGTRLLQIPGNLYGLLKPFSYILITSGVCFITVILSPVGYTAEAVSDGMLGIIFFRAAEQSVSPSDLLNRPIE